MINVMEKPEIDGVIWPKQERGMRTFEKLLQSAQSILQESGIEALNSNAIAEGAGVTIPVFYQYFGDKYALLAVLGHRLTEAQNKLYVDSAAKSAEITKSREEQFETDSLKLLQETYRVTAAFAGSRALLISLRALPELTEIRLKANRDMAKIGGNILRQIRPDLSMKDATERARVSIEIGYSVVEMLLEVPSISRKRVLERTNKAIVAVFFDG